MPPAWRPMTEADLPAVQAMADRLHPHHPEAPAVFAERLALAPAGCRVLAAGAGCWAMPSPIPGPGRRRRRSMRCWAPCRTRPGAWHVHDIALDPRRAAAGHAAAVLRALLAASPLPRATLVAIPGTGDYWARQGFRDAPVDDAAALASYGAGRAVHGAARPERAARPARGASAAVRPRASAGWPDRLLGWPAAPCAASPPGSRSGGIHPVPHDFLHQRGMLLRAVDPQHLLGEADVVPHHAGRPAWRRLPASRRSRRWVPPAASSRRACRARSPASTGRHLAPISSAAALLAARLAGWTGHPQRLRRHPLIAALAAGHFAVAVACRPEPAPAARSGMRSGARCSTMSRILSHAMAAGGSRPSLR